MDDKDIIKLGLGIVIVQAIVKLLKKIIKQPRPFGNTLKTYGMPSSRTAIVFFVITYLIFSLKNKTTNKIIILLSVGLLSALLKWIMKEHSFVQLLIGGIIGFSFGYLLKKI